MNIRNIPFVIQPIRKFRSLLGQTPEVLSLRQSKSRTPGLIQDYLRKHSQEPKLQIGCQSHPFDGWLNVDIEPKADGIAFMDATERFPLPDNTFSYVYSEHMIEHISLAQGLFMLKECYRIMKPGAAIRLVTPNLKFLVDFYTESKNETQQAYQEFSKKYFKSPSVYNDAVVMNNFFRDWGHQFIYDEKTLHAVLKESGFKNIITGKVYESKHAVLNNLEHHQLEITDAFNRLESIVVEAIK
jgi:predicted SAM-dependent methyltransferase